MLARGRAGAHGGDARGGAVITCPKCNKENQDHYKFCLGCGAELPRDASPKKFAAGGTPPHGMQAVPKGAAADGVAHVVRHEPLGRPPGAALDHVVQRDLHR